MQTPGGDMMMAAGLSLVVLAAALRNIIPPAPSTTVGIDLGTTFSCVAVFDHGRVHVIEVEANSTILPSVVALKDGSDPIVGRAAHAAGPDYGIVYDAKRFIGRAYDDEAPESLALEAAQLPFDVVRGWSEERRRAETHILPRGAPRPVRAEQISAMVLEKLRRAAEGHIGRPVRAAVLAVPVDFSEAQRNATREAARLANVEVLRLLHEPTAAAIAYGLHDRPSVRTVMVYDLGGGTLDVSLLHLDNGIFSVVSAAGNNFLGGQDVNRILARHFLTDAASPLAGREEDHATAAALRAAVERLKVALSSRCECTGECRRPADAEVSVPVELGGGERPMITLSRQGLERLIEPFVNAAMAPVDELLAELEMSIDDVDELVLVGGSTRIPAIRTRLTALLGGKEPNCALPPEEAVARGTAIQAGILVDAKKVPVGATEAVFTRRRSSKRMAEAAEAAERDAAAAAAEAR